MAFAVTGLYVSKVGVQSIGTGSGYGIVFGILCAGIDLIRFAIEPLTTKTRGQFDLLRDRRRIGWRNP